MTDSTGSETLRALVDRLFPPTTTRPAGRTASASFSPASSARPRDRADAIPAGLAELDARARGRGAGGFAGLPADAQDEIIADVLAGGAGSGGGERSSS